MKFNKKILLSVFVVLCLAQIGFLIYLSISNDDVFKTGTEFKFKTVPVDPFDAFRGRYITLSFEAENLDEDLKIHEIEIKKKPFSGEAYLTVDNNQEGFAEIIKISFKKPINNTNFFKAKFRSNDNGWTQVSFPFNKYYLEESFAIKGEQIYNQRVRAQTEKPAYAVVAIKNGKAVLKDLYIEDKPIVKLIKEKLTGATSLK